MAQPQEAGEDDLVLVVDGVVALPERLEALSYEIVVDGGTLTTLGAVFVGCAVDVGKTRTMLRCEVLDQAALFRVLDRVFEVGLELVAVRRIERGAAVTDVSSDRYLS